MKHGFGEFLTRIRFKEKSAIDLSDSSSQEIEKQKISHPQRFRLLLETLGTTYIKLGQLLSTRPDVLPPEYIYELQKLQDQCPPMSFEDVTSQIEQSFRKNISELFSSFEEKPLASASISQVHRATTLDGEQVVVKVQRLHLKSEITTDLDILYYFASLFESVIEETSIFRPVNVVREFEYVLTTEIDFRFEGQNVQLFNQNHKTRKNIVIPKFYPELSNERVLTLEYLEGLKLTEFHDPETKRNLAIALIEEALTQVFVDGVFHGDFHPGNILILSDQRIALIDFGIVGKINAATQKDLLFIILSIALKDSDSLARTLYRHADRKHHIQIHQLSQNIDNIFKAYLGKELNTIDKSRMVHDLFHLAVSSHIEIPQEYMLLTKNLISFGGIIESLYPDIDVVKVLVPHIKGLLREQYIPDDFGNSALKGLVQVSSFMNDLPRQLNQILFDLEMGKLTFGIKEDATKKIEDHLYFMAILLFWGIILAALLLGTFYSFSVSSRLLFHRPIGLVMGSIGFLSSGIVFGSVITWLFFRKRMRKIRIKKFLEK